jgi:hypothetical protein
MLSQPDCPVISRLGRLEEVDGVGLERLSLHPGVPKYRDLRFDFAIATSSDFGAQQHRGRTGQTLDGLVQTVSRKCPGLSDGSRETQVLLSLDLGYLDKNQTECLLSATAEVGRILNGLLASLPNRSGH